MSNESPLTLHKKAAGKMITTKVPIVSVGATISDVKKLLLKNTKQYDTINYIYVVNKKGKFVGVFSVKELFAHTKTAKIAQIMKRDPIGVRYNTHREKAAELALKSNIKAVPVVNKTGLFLGVIENDDIMEILYEEMQEDIFHSAGVTKHKSKESVLALPLKISLKNRIPWLIIGLFGGLLASKIVGHFEETIAKNLILATFIPLIVYMADATKIQMEAFMIRELSVNSQMKFSKYFFKQLSVVFLLAIIISTILMGMSAVLHQDLQISMILGIGLFCAMMSSLFSGMFVPFFFSKINIDPANASGPIATIFQDIFSIIIYFVVATALL
ncbi:MAG: magnesium transporter [Candidatus Gracilibacteria bacterium]|nr:magnesium transporter [Candidatus Gracilibacteria bacterium]